MKTVTDELTQYLTTQPLARERKNKDRAIVNLLLTRFQGLRTAIENNMTTKEELTRFVKAHATYDRGWRKVTEENEDLRGSDYEEKAELEHRTQTDLGYRVAPLQP